MQKGFRGVIVLGTLIVAMGIAGLLRIFPKSPADFFSKSAQVYWTETEIAESELLDLISDDSCQSSQKYFLSCVNAIQNASSRLHLSLNFDGTLGIQQESDLGLVTEKSLLQPWRQYYLSDPKKASALSFISIWEQLKKNKSFLSDRSATIAAGLNGFLSVFKDPHSYLIPVSYYSEVVAQLNPKTLSLGIVITKGLDQYFVRKVLESSSADQAGLKKGDLLLEVNSEKISDFSMQKVSDLMKASEGDITEILIQRGDQKRLVKVHRSSQSVPSVSWKYQASKKYAILNINKFAKGSCDKVIESLQSISRKENRGLLIDLRDNSGGQMEEAVCIASLFLGKDREILSLQYRDPAKEIERMFGPHEQVYFGAIAVLINSGTASAAEIVAGVLQEYHRAVLVGERTFGKGTFQEGEVWDANSKIALFETKGFFAMPSGRSPQIVGIVPDVPVVFKASRSLREEDLYMNPLKPMRLTNSQVAKNPLRIGRCSDISMQNKNSEKDGEFDPQLDTATELLNCPGVADIMTGY